jgi:hypothetical protein
MVLSRGLHYLSTVMVRVSRFLESGFQLPPRLGFCETWGFPGLRKPNYIKKAQCYML